MVSKARTLTGALILCLIVVPALARATRTFDPGSRPRLAPSFNKSFDVPPEVIHLAPAPLVAAPLCLAGGAPRLVGVPVLADSQHVVDPLRGPPFSVRS